MPPIFHESTVPKYDLVLIGGGSGGSGCSRRAAQHGAKVAVVEMTPHLGGTCVNVGCVPKKIMWHAADLYEKLSIHAPGYHLVPPSSHSNSSPVAFDWANFKTQRDAYIRKLNGIYHNNFDKEGVEFHQGYGKLLSPTSVEVTKPDGTGTYVLETDKIVLAMGGTPTIPSSIPGAQELGIDSDGFFELEKQPKKVVLVGAGYIAVELAGIFNTLGTETHLVIRHDAVLRTFDPSLSDVLVPWMEKTGMHIHKNSNVTKLSGKKGEITVELDDGSTIETEQVIFAIGRRSLTANMGLEAAGVKLAENGDVVVDEYQTSSVPNIYAIGDVQGKALLTPVAIAAGRRLSNRLFGGEQYKNEKLSYEDIPSVVFTHPTIGSVGLTEPQAREKYGDSEVKIYKSNFRSLYFSMVDESHKEPSMYKLVCVGPEEKVVGVHIIGAGSDEVLQGFAVAVKLGARKRDLDDTVAIHPTSAEELVTLR